MEEDQKLKKIINQNPKIRPEIIYQTRIQTKKNPKRNQKLSGNQISDPTIRYQTRNQT